MRNPLAAWRAGVRWPAIVLGVLAALVVAVLVCEALGWPFLVRPAEHWLGKTLDRRVAFDDDAGRGEGVKLHLLGSVRVTASRIEIGAPAWSQEPHMLLARDARLSLGYPDLWRARQGRTLRLKALEASSLDAALERRADGSASWQFGRKEKADADEEGGALPNFGVLRVRDGHLTYRDELLPATLDARFALSDGSAPAPAPAAASLPASAGAAASAAASASGPAGGIVVRAGGAASGAAKAEPVPLAPGESGFRLAAVGQYRKLPVRIDLRTAGVLRFLDRDRQREAQPVRLMATIGGADLTFTGSTVDPLHFTGLQGRFTLDGTSLAAVGDPLGITLPTTPRFRSRGTLSKDGSLWKATFDEATIGTSRLDGAFTYDARRKVPLLAGRLGGSRLVLHDLGPAVGTPVRGDAAAATAAGASSPRGGRVIPDKKFDLPSLRAMDANVLIDIAMFDPGTTVIEPMRPVRAHLLLAEGVLTIADFAGTTAQGRIAGFLQLDGRGPKALWTADMRGTGIDLSQWLNLKRGKDSPPYLSGKLDALVKVKGSGRSTAEILGSLGGDIRVHLRDAWLSHLIVEAAGLDIGQALGVFVKGDDSLKILCNAIDLDVVDGVARPKVAVIDTKDSTVLIDGTVSLKNEALDLRAIVSPKDFSPFALRSPIHVRGTLGAPAVSVEMGKLAGKAGAAALLSLLTPLAALVPFIDPGSGDAAKSAAKECAALVPTSGRIPGATRQPAELHVPPPASAPAARPGNGASGVSASR